MFAKVVHATGGGRARPFDHRRASAAARQVDGLRMGADRAPGIDDTVAAALARLSSKPASFRVDNDLRDVMSMDDGSGDDRKQAASRASHVSQVSHTREDAYDDDRRQHRARKHKRRGDKRRSSAAAVHDAQRTPDQGRRRRSHHAGAASAGAINSPGHHALIAFHDGARQAMVASGVTPPRSGEYDTDSELEVGVSLPSGAEAGESKRLDGCMPPGAIGSHVGDDADDGAGTSVSVRSLGRHVKLPPLGSTPEPRDDSQRSEGADSQKGQSSGKGSVGSGALSELPSSKSRRRRGSLGSSDGHTKYRVSAGARKRPKRASQASVASVQSVSGHFGQVASAINRFGAALKFKRETDKHAEMLSDLRAAQSFNDEGEDLTLVPYLPRCCIPCCKRTRRHIIPLDSTFTRLWDVWFIIAVFWVVSRVPFVIAFGHNSTGIGLLVMDNIMKSSFAIDLVLRFLSETMVKGYIVREPVRIAVHYLSGWFLIDLVASLPYDFIVGRGSLWGLLSLLRLFSLVKVETVEKRLTASLEMSPTSRLLLRLVKLFAYMLFIAHITACVWFLIAKQEDNPDASWIYLYGIHDASWEESLLSSYYWAFTTLTTVGYGDISAHTNVERAWSCVMLCMGAAMFAVLVGKMSALSQAMNEEESAGTKRRDEVAYYLKLHDVPAHIRQRTRAYYDYIMHAQTFLDEDHMLADLSPPLRREVGVHLNAQLLTQVPVLKSADPAFQAAIVSMLRPTVVLINEYIICAGDIGYEMYILRIGAVGVLGTDGRQLYTLSDGSFFGEDQLLYRQRATHSFRARDNCEMYRLHRVAFRNLIEDFPDFEATLRKAATERKNLHANAARIQQKKTPSWRRKHGEPELVRPDSPPMGFPTWEDVARVVREKAEFPGGNKLARTRVMAAMEYEPQPLNFDHLRIPMYLDPLVEAMAINMHEVWASNRREQGWQWGEARDDDSKLHPDLMPYECMDDSSLAFDRRLSNSIVRFVLGRGYNFSCEGSVAQLSTWLKTVRHYAEEFRGYRDDGAQFTYTPFPFHTEDTMLPPALMDLVEAISKNIHEVWAEERIKSGWSWGPHRDNTLKRHPSLLPYELLSSDEQMMNRAPVVTTMKMVTAMGFGLVLGGPSTLVSPAAVDNRTRKLVSTIAGQAKSWAMEQRKRRASQNSASDSDAASDPGAGDAQDDGKALGGANADGSAGTTAAVAFTVGAGDASARKRRLSLGNRRTKPPQAPLSAEGAGGRVSGMVLHGGVSARSNSNDPLSPSTPFGTGVGPSPMVADNSPPLHPDMMAIGGSEFEVLTFNKAGSRRNLSSERPRRSSKPGILLLVPPVDGSDAVAASSDGNAPAPPTSSAPAADSANAGAGPE